MKSISDEILPLPCALYSVVLMEHELEKMEIVKMLTIGVIELVEVELAPLIVLAPKMDRSLRFFVDGWKLNATTVSDYYPFQEWMSTSICYGTHQYSPHYTEIAAFGILRSKMQISTKIFHFASWPDKIFKKGILDCAAHLTQFKKQRM